MARISDCYDLDMKAVTPLQTLHASAVECVAEPFRSRLLSMYAKEPQTGSDGQRYALDAATRVVPAQGAWLYRLCTEMKPEHTLEIGLACGYSTVFFLAAIAANGTGHHTALDPYQQEWHGIGAAHAEHLGMKDSFTWIEERSSSALVHLADRGQNFGVIFIDGGHRFDDALVDFTLAAPLCALGGCIILDDLWMPSIRAVVAFVRRNRSDFEELSTPIPNIAAFRRIGDDRRTWNHFAPARLWDSIGMKLRTSLQAWRD